MTGPGEPPRFALALVALAILAWALAGVVVEAVAAALGAP